MLNASKQRAQLNQHFNELIKEMLKEQSAKGAPLFEVAYKRVQKLLSMPSKDIAMKISNSQIANTLKPVPSLWSAVENRTKELLGISEIAKENVDWIMTSDEEIIKFLGIVEIINIFIKHGWEQHFKTTEEVLQDTRIFYVQSMLAYKILPLIVKPQWLEDAERYIGDHDLVHGRVEKNEDLQLIEASFVCLFANFGYMYSPIIQRPQFRKYLDALEEFKEDSFEANDFQSYHLTENIFLPSNYSDEEKETLNYSPLNITFVYLEKTGLSSLADRLKNYNANSLRNTNELSLYQKYTKGALILAAILLCESNIERSYVLLDIWEQAMELFPIGDKNIRFSKKKELIIKKIVRTYFNDIIFDGEELKLFNRLRQLCHSLNIFDSNTNYSQFLVKVRQVGRSSLQELKQFFGDIEHMPTPLVPYFSDIAQLYNDEINQNSQIYRSTSKLGKGIKNLCELLYLYIVNCTIPWCFSNADSSPNDNLRLFHDSVRKNVENVKNEVFLLNAHVREFIGNNVTFPKDINVLKKHFIGILEKFNQFYEKKTWTKTEVKNFFGHINKILEIFFTLSAYQSSSQKNQNLAQYFRIYIPAKPNSSLSPDKLVINPFILLETQNPEELELAVIPDGDMEKIFQANELYNKHQYPRFFQEFITREITVRTDDELDQIKMRGKGESIGMPAKVKNVKKNIHLFPLEANWIPIEPYIVITKSLLGNNMEYYMKLLRSFKYNDLTGEYENIYIDFVSPI